MTGLAALTQEDLCYCACPEQPPVLHVTFASACVTLEPLPVAPARGGHGTGRLLQPAPTRPRHSEIRSARILISVVFSIHRAKIKI